MAWWCWARAGAPRPRRLPVLLEQRQGFRRARPPPAESPAGSAEAGPVPQPRRRRSLFPPPPPPPPHTGRPSPQRLVKPLIFAVGGWSILPGKTGLTTLCPTPPSSQALPSGPPPSGSTSRSSRGFRPILRKLGQTGWIKSARRRGVTSESRYREPGWLVHTRINSWWNSLTEGQRTVTGIIAANVFVFCLWRLPGMRRVMFTYFTSNPSSKAVCSPMLLSTFSHFSLFHMAANMYVLWSFSSSIVSLLGCEQFIAVYLSAGVISTFVSYVAKMATGRFEPSLGASGAIMTVLAAVCTKIPEAKLAIIFLPMVTFTAGSALKAIIAFDTAGLALGWRLFDHAAHLGGALFGMWYVTYGHELIWKNREPLVKAWHEMRTKNTGKGGGGRFS
ncbi:presenilin-associated rhomboid-like protein, mitochondrial isoform X1 [Heliangelus exortis]|uniref:presenilin-associated rhomboid-like protein, mitochondrial isoform X1 n=1 Tax=Heliangelus exortis TaxID=472823 RepID=UPI003A936906